MLLKRADRTALSGIAVQLADDGSLIRSMVLIYSPDGTNVYGLRGGSLRGYGRCRGWQL